MLVAIAVAAAFGAFVWNEWRSDPSYVTDFDQIWVGARAVMLGRNPYDLIGPGREFPYDFRLFYPLPALIAATPFALLPLPLARVFFIAIPAGFLTYLVTAGGTWRLLVIASRPMISNAHLVQWTPWLTLALLAPWAGWFLPGKPNLGLATVAGLQFRAVVRTLAYALIPIILSFVVQPGWVADWLSALRESQHFRSYLQHPGGFLLLLCLLRWRRWEARLLFVLALVPQTPGVMPTLPLLLIPNRPAVLMGISVLTFTPSAIVPYFGDYTNFTTLQPAIALVTLWAVFIPTLLIVLRRPNEGDIPGWLENRIARWPVWIRGTPGSQGSI